MGLGSRKSDFCDGWLRGLLFTLSILSAVARGQGFDTGQGAVVAAEMGTSIGKKVDGNKSWLRIRGLPDPLVATPEEVAGQQVALQRIKDTGLRACVLFWPSAKAWRNGVRAIPNSHLPLDLREAVEWMRRLETTYGPWVDAWEIDNEPDIQSVNENVETYTAYLKACWWGTQGGDAASAQRTQGGGRRVVDDGGLGRSSVMAGGLAMPPGPYLERFVANGGLTFIDGFNYHYYGYAHDFSGGYRQFRAAAKELSSAFVKEAKTILTDKDRHVPRVSSATDPTPAESSPVGAQTGSGGLGVVGFRKLQHWLPDILYPTPLKIERKPLQVFLTEYGYGMLDSQARNTVRGRVLQWEWFRDVGQQIDRLRIEGPMAFVLMPYLEYEAKEFGLTMKPASSDAEKPRKDGGPDTTPVSPSPSAPSALKKVRVAASDSPSSVSCPPSSDLRPPLFAAGLAFSPADFGAKKPEPWMKGIGRSVAGGVASPALAWMLEDAEKPRRPSVGWKIKTLAPCPVVIDFVAGAGLSQTKQSHGYWLQRTTTAGRSWCEGEGEIRLYNFGREPMAGELDLGLATMAGAGDGGGIELQPGEMRVLPVRLRVQGPGLSRTEWRVSFVPAGRRTVSVFSTLLLSTPTGATRRVWRSLDPKQAGPANTAVLAGRPLVRQEPPETQGDGWSVTRGVRVTETADGWDVSISQLPEEPTRPAIAELILPDDFQIPDRGLLSLEYRVVPPGLVAGGRSAATISAKSDVIRDAIGIAWRTANGNLFTVWRPPPATTTWQRYSQMKESFTLGAYGRVAAPWRFSENRPVALVFTFLPGQLPAVFQIRRAEIVSY